MTGPFNLCRRSCASAPRHSRTPILFYSQTITPKDHFINWQQDPFGNYLARLVFPKKTKEFTVVADLVADMITSPIYLEGNKMHGHQLQRFAY